jgi:organic hydroperoxide reductase OsmC/OhrA
MMGTFAAVLAKSRIHTWEDRYHADVTGDIEAVDGVLKIVRIKVQYTLKVAEDKRADAEAAFETYMPHCPAAMTVIDAIDLAHDITYEAL